MLGRGGTNGNSIFPSFVEENQVQYENNMFPQLQLFGHVPVHSGSVAGTINNRFGTGQAPGIVGDTVCIQQKLQMCLNNFYPAESVHLGSASNHNVVSTGLKLSCEEDERKSTLTSPTGEITRAPLGLSVGTAIKTEMDRRTDELSRYIKIQEQTMLKGVREMSQRHAVSLLSTLEKSMNQKVHEKDLEIESMNRKNKELGDKIKQVAMEAQSWHCKAKYNESIINALKTNIHQLMAQGNVQAKEGSGDSEVDDAISCSGHDPVMRSRMSCRACNTKEVSVLIMPCRHMCLCSDCEGFINFCPVCQVMKTASLGVYM